jgi:hypothetical protein
MALASTEKRREAQEGLLDAIIAKTKVAGAPNTDEARALHHLCEAYAWVVSPSEAHGGGVTRPGTS